MKLYLSMRGFCSTLLAITFCLLSAHPACAADADFPPLKTFEDPVSDGETEAREDHDDGEEGAMISMALLSLATIAADIGFTVQDIRLNDRGTRPSNGYAAAEALVTLPQAALILPMAIESRSKLFTGVGLWPLGLASHGLYWLGTKTVAAVPSRTAHQLRMAPQLGLFLGWSM